MKPTKGYYSLIQYCPDCSRSEAANIGLVLFIPESNFLLAKTSTSNHRISSFFGRQSFDSDRVNFLKSSIEKRLEKQKERFASLEDFERFIKTRANELLITDPRPIRVLEPEQQFNELFKELVGGRLKPKKTRTLFRSLDATFRNQLKDRMSFDLVISVPVANHPIQIPYAYRNGVRNLIKPQAFGPKGTDTGLKLAAEGKLIQENPAKGEECRLIILPQIQNVENPKVFRSSLSQLFDEFKIRTVWDEQIDKFTAEVAREARPQT